MSTKEHISSGFKPEKRGTKCVKKLSVNAADLTAENIRQMLEAAAAQFLGDKGKPDQLRTSSFRRPENGTKDGTIGWMGKRMHYQTFLRHAGVSLGVGQTVRETRKKTGAVLDRLFGIAGVQNEGQRKRVTKREDIDSIWRRELFTHKKVLGVLEEAAEKFLGDKSKIAQLSTSSFRCGEDLIQEETQNHGTRRYPQIHWEGEAMGWQPFLRNVAIALGVASSLEKARSKTAKALRELFAIVGIEKINKPRVP